jgi:hypothetical protein
MLRHFFGVGEDVKRWNFDFLKVIKKIFQGNLSLQKRFLLKLISTCLGIPKIREQVKLTFLGSPQKFRETPFKVN